MHVQLAQRAVNALAVLAALLLVAIATYTSIDAIVRKLASTALPGAVDVVGYGLGIVIALGLPYCTMQLGHVAVPVFVTMIPGRLGAVVRRLAPLLSTIFFVLMAWQIGRVALKRMASGDQMWMIAVETWPIWIGITALLCVTALTQAAVLVLPEDANAADTSAMLKGEAA
ncbi:TRAP transporter small permease [Acuticoccus sediminis]|nr:TRAP transporter small permease [Acuticoccus sediminis]